jgi:hypothetical protein
MSLADYYARAALAASQVLGGFDEELFQRALAQNPVGISIGLDASRAAEGRAALDLLIRLFSRLYPAIAVIPSTGAEDEAARLVELALEINPNLDLLSEPPRLGAVVGTPDYIFEHGVFVGSDGWDAFVSSENPLPIGASPNPVGAGIAACIAAGEIFKAVFTPESERINDLVFSGYTRQCAPTPADVPNSGWTLDNVPVLVGAGAIGNAALWALAKSSLDGELWLIDHESIDLGNLQRYVMAVRSDEGRSKVELGSQLPSSLRIRPAAQTWAEFVNEHGHTWDVALCALDSAADRRAVQASLPQTVINAWTQPGDLGLSVHATFGNDGACLYCLYLTDRELPSEDELVAQALGIPERTDEIRTLLHLGNGLDRDLADVIAERMHLPLDRLSPFVGRPVRDLYVEGICGGALLPLGQSGTPRQDVHVPLAHQSALAGVLLAAGLVRLSIEGPLAMTEITRLDVLTSFSQYPTQLSRRSGGGRCICEDSDYTSAYEQKYARHRPAAPVV